MDQTAERTLEQQIKEGYMEAVREVKALREANDQLQETIDELQESLSTYAGIEMELQGALSEITGLRMHNEMLRKDRERTRIKHLKKLDKIMSMSEHAELINKRAVSIGYGLGIALGGLTLLLAFWAAT